MSDVKIIVPSGEPLDTVETVDKLDPVLESDLNPIDDTGNEPVEETPKSVETPEPTEESTEEIDIDGVIYKLDSEGNAVDTNGNIKYTKETIQGYESENSDTLDISKILEITNIKPVDEQGNPIQYEPTQEGIAKYISDVYAIASNQSIEDYQNQLFNTYPILFDVINHLSNNGSLEGFNKTVDYSTLELDENNETQLVNIIREARRMRGEEDSKIDKYVNYLKDSNSLALEAEEERKYLVAIDETNRTKQAEVAKAQELEQQQQAQSYWGVALNEKGQLVNLNKPDSIYGIIKSGKIKVGEESYVIPEKIRISQDGKITYKTRDEFFNYLYNPVEIVVNNQKIKATQYELDLHNRNFKRGVNDDVFDAFKQFVNYDTSQFIKENLNSQEVKKIIKRINTKINKQSATVDNKTTGKIVIPRND
jgi:hypothetical protein